MPNFSISEIWSYPIKSLAGIRHQSATCHKRGLEYDRNWMIIDEKNRFISQRSHPKMALLQPEIQNINGEISLTIFEIQKPANKISLTQSEAFGHGNPLVNATVWDDTVAVLEAKGMVNAWLSSNLEQYVRLVYLPENSLRLVEKKYNQSGNSITSLSDGYPYLLIGTASLQCLNEKLNEQVDLRRFRPNIVVNTVQAHEEDNWKNIKINEVLLHGTKLCARCPIPDINPDTAISTKSVIKTLNTYRNIDNKVYFGQNLLISNIGKINLGDTLEID